VRASTKFQVGDLLVKAARHPKRAVLLPRDLIRLYRLRRHRRQLPAAEVEATIPGRLRRTELADEEAARLLLPRIAARDDRPLAIAGALDAEHLAAWGRCVAATSVLPHDAATLTTEVDPDIVVIDARSTMPTGPWAHLGNPAAVDRGIAAQSLIEAAKQRGRPTVFLRYPDAEVGLAPIARRCDLILDTPGCIGDRPWHPGIDLAIAGQVDPRVLAGETDCPAGDSVLWAGSTSSPTVSAWSTLSQWSHDTGHRISHPNPAMLAAPRQISALNAARVVVVDSPGRPGEVGAGPWSLLALACGRPLVGPADPDLGAILGVQPGTPEAHALGWFAVSVTDLRDGAAWQDSLQSAWEHGATPWPVRWDIWRALFARASAEVMWHRITRELHLTTNPEAVRQCCLVLTDTDVGLDVAGLARAIAGQSDRILEVAVDSVFADRLRHHLAIAQPTSAVPEVISLPVIAHPNSGRDQLMRTAQSASAPLLLEMDTRTFLEATESATGDAIIASQLAGPQCQVRLRSVDNRLDVTCYDRNALVHQGCGSTTSASIIHPGGAS
jgi:hypothetical protein